MKIFVRLLLFSIPFLLLSYAAQAEDKPGNPAYAWLEGKWSGTAADGGPMTIDLRVINDNEITGTSVAQVTQKGRLKTIEHNISGKITPDGKVIISLEWSGGRSLRWGLKRNDDGSLEGIKNKKLFFAKVP